MAFIRQYQRGNLYDYAGDPGFGKFLKRAFKPPKAIRKLQPFKAVTAVVKKALPFAASLIPGVGGLVAGALGGLAPQAERPSFTPAPEPEPLPMIVPPTTSLPYLPVTQAEAHEMQLNEYPDDAVLELLIRLLTVYAGDPLGRRNVPAHRRARAARMGR